MTTAGDSAPRRPARKTEPYASPARVMALGAAGAANYWKYALWLALLTVLYNLAEGLVSVYFGAHDEALTLFGFGIDSFVEVVSGMGVLAMVVRIRRNPEAARGPFERTALRVTGAAFYLLSAGLGMIAVLNVVTAHKPSTTLPGLIISLISIAAMWALVWGKQTVGLRLGCSPILADAKCTLVCIYMSCVLLAASFVYQITGLGFVDSLGAAGLIYFSVHEGNEAFEKARAIGD